jgi:hypothetical protein
LRGYGDIVSSDSGQREIAMTTANRHVIRKDGLLYKLAYRSIREQDRPTKVHICVLVCMAMVNIVEWIVVAVAFIAVCCLVVIIISVVGRALWELGSSLIAWLADPYLPSIREPGVYQTVVVGSALFFIFGVTTAVVWGVSAFVKSETVRLLADYLRAKTEKICSIYEVVE